jgi:hypothetical protein
MNIKEILEKLEEQEKYLNDLITQQRLTYPDVAVIQLAKCIYNLNQVCIGILDVLKK